MSLTTIRAQVSIPHDDALPEDAITNTLHFRCQNVAATVAADAANIHGRLATFYQALDGEILAASVNTPANVKYYDLADAEPRVPVYTAGITLTPSTGYTLPSEVALCLSFQAVAVSGLDQRNRRGRIYLGPVTSSAMDITAPFSRPLAATLTAINAAASTFKASCITGQVPWAVYSPTLHSPSGGDFTLTDATALVANGWTDNAWDTMRSRGTAATTRNTWT